MPADVVWCDGIVIVDADSIEKLTAEGGRVYAEFYAGSGLTSRTVPRH